MYRPQLVERFEILISIPGVGALTAITMLIEMPELGSLDNKQVKVSVQRRVLLL